MAGKTMRKLILIAAISVLATQSYAGGSRGLSLAAANTNQQATEQQAVAGTPSTAAQPAARQTATVTPDATTQPAATTAPAASAAPTQAATKPKRRAPSIETRVVRELHRHGIYW
jgi:hypothetical protein